MNILKSVTNLLSPHPTRGGKPRPFCGPVLRSQTLPNSTRTNILDDFVYLYGYPSRGGFIVLERATPVHFEFLSLSRVDPPKSRAATPEAEDAFCQRLLLLGAKWFDSEDRYRFMCFLEEDSYRAIMDLGSGKQKDLTLRERRWIEVAWEGDPAEDADAGVWVAEWDINLNGVLDWENMKPEDAARVTLGRDMRERCQILEGMGATLYKPLGKYPADGAVSLRAWEWKVEGEVAELEQTWV